MDAFKDYMTAFLGAIVLFISLITIKELRQNKIRQTVTIIVIIFLAYLGLDKVHRDNKKDEVQVKEKKDSDLTIKSLTKNVEALKTNHINDSVTFAGIYMQLEKQYHFLKDSSKSSDVKKVFTTYFKHADKVIIGGD